MANFLSTLFDHGGFLQNPGDRVEARVTKTGKKVIKAQIGDKKWSAVQQPSGKIVETRSYFPDK